MAAPFPDYVLEASETILTTLLPVLAARRGAIGDDQAAARAARTIDALLSDTRAAARSATLGDDIAAAFDDSRLALADPRIAISLFARVVTAARAIKPVAVTSAASAGQRQNEIALAGLFEWLAIAGQCQALGDVDLRSYDEARRYRLNLARSIDISIERASDLGLQDVMMALRTAQGKLVRDMIERGRPLARIVTYRTAVPLPAVVLAHRLYQDAGRATELMAENAHNHPGFMPLSGRAYSR